MSKNSNTTELKKQYLSYYADVPIQKYAAEYVGRDEDTIIRWRKNDIGFADAIKRLKSEWIRKKLLATKAEFALERLESELFEKKKKDNNTLYSFPKPIIYFPNELPNTYPLAQIIDI